MIDLFVYGTLKQGHGLHGVLADQEFLGAASVEGFTLLDCGAFPAMIRAAGSVNGELYRVDDKTLRQVDRIEGEGYLYVRTPVDAVLPDGRTIAAHAYLWNQLGRRLPSIGSDWPAIPVGK